MEFIQGAYDKNEHDFVGQTTEKLQAEQMELTLNMNRVKYNPERRAQLERRMANISFELSERVREQRGLEINEAWGNR